jgi:hypothetical protein
LFSLASSKLTSLLISRKVTPFFISKYNTLISTLHGLGLCIAKGYLLLFLHFCIQKIELNGSRSSPTQPIWILKKEIKVWCIVLNFPLQQRKCKHLHLHLFIVIWKTLSSIYYIKDKTLAVQNFNLYSNICFKHLRKNHWKSSSSIIGLVWYRPIKSNSKVHIDLLDQL